MLVFLADKPVMGAGDGEVLKVLHSHDIAYSIVPATTAASCCAAYAGIPSTHRDQAHSVHLVTASGKNAIERVDRTPDTRFLHGHGNIRSRAMPPAGPWSASIEPAAIAKNGARPASGC